MHRFFRPLGLAAFSALACWSPARADVLFASVADLTVPYDQTFCSACFGSGDPVVDGFTATTSGQANQVTVAVESAFFGPSAITFDVYSGTPDALGAQLLDLTADPSDFIASVDTGQDTTLVTFATPAFDLAAGQSYSVSFFNPDTLVLPGYDGGATVSFQSGAPLQFGTSTGFEIDGAAGAAVPEPAAWALLILGFGLAGSRLRRRHAKGLAA
jgi:hypothetical protein